MTFLLHFISYVLIATKVSTSTVVLYDNNEGDTNSNKLVVEDDTAYVGGTNYFLIIDLSKPSPADVQRVNFAPDEKNRNLCKRYGRNSHCENTVRILDITSRGVLICGTNARTPKCFYYNKQNATLIDANLDADAWLSESPTICTKTLASNEHTPDDYFYAASTKSNGEIFVRKLPSSLETKKEWFTEPEFKGIYSGPENQNVYLFFNEKSTNFIEDQFVAKNERVDYYSMVARVCKNDQGGSWEKDEWVTFNKVRLTCPWPGDGSESETDLLYNELISTYQDGNSIFGLFRTNRKWNLPTYALAEYDLQYIDDIIEGKFFSTNKTMYFDKTKHKNAASFHPKEGIPPFLPGECPSTTTYSLKSEFERFVRDNTLVKMNVIPEDGKPFFLSNEATKYRFIFVQNLSWTKLVYLLSENGDLKKIAFYPDRSVVEIFEQKGSLNGIILAAELVADKGYILATTASKVITIPLQQCSANHDCGSCNADPHCEWTERSTSTGFECRVAEALDTRTCFATPDVPENVLINVNEDDVEISWDQQGPVSQIFNIISINAARTKETVYLQKTANRKLIVKRSILQDGCDYEVSAKAVNNSALSSETKKYFTTDLRKPEVTLYQKDERTGVTWTKVSGAAKYIVQLLDDEKEITQKLLFLPTNTDNIFYIPDMKPGEPYTVAVRAISEDGVESFIEETFSSVVTKTSNKSTAKAQTKSAEPYTVAIKTTSEDSVESFVVETTSTVTPTKPNKSIAKASVTKKEDCSSLVLALAIFIVLFVATLFIVLHSIWIIRPGIKELKNDNDGFTYKRRKLCIWSKKKNVTHLKCENAMISASEA